MNFVKSPVISKPVSYPEAKVFEFGNFGLGSLNPFLPRFMQQRKSDDVPSAMFLWQIRIINYFRKKQVNKKQLSKLLQKCPGHNKEIKKKKNWFICAGKRKLYSLSLPPSHHKFAMLFCDPCFCLGCDCYDIYPMYSTPGIGLT